MSYVIPSDFSTELSAVNALLGSIGESPVSSLEGGEAADAQGALNKLAEWSRTIQAKGWHWNREDAFPLTPNGDGEIQVPANAIYVGKAYLSYHGNSSKNLVQRAGKIYNKTDHTFQFTETVYADIVIFLEWEDLPEYARQAIIYNAIMRFQMEELTSTSLARVESADIEGAMTTLEQREDEAEPRNSISGNKFIQRSLNGNVLRRS